MKSKKDNYFGIYINDKIPKIDDEDNKYHKKIELNFEGRAFIVEKNRKDIETIKEELESGKKYEREGKHTIKFINKSEEIYYINIEIRKLWLIWLFLLVFFIIFGCILFFNNTKIPNFNQVIQESVNYDLELEGLKYVFDINYGNETTRTIELTDKVSGKKFIYPGSYGNFYVVISTKNGNKDMSYKMQVKEETNKPKNLKFMYNGKVYESAKELAKSINGEIAKNSEKLLKIDWLWNYDTNDDNTDTLNGENSENYRFLISMMGTEGG